MSADLQAVPRLVTIWCPDWPVVAAAGQVPAGQTRSHRATHRVAVVRANRVLARSPAAAGSGVEIGQRRRDAQRCCPELILVDHDPARDAREFEPVVRSVAEMAPRLDVIEPGWITLAARGPSRYFGGDLALARQLAEMVGDLIDAPVGVGIADGRTASAVAARRAVRASSGTDGLSLSVIAAGGSAEFLAPLPVAWLRLLGDAEPELVDVLSRLGIHTLGDLAAVSGADVLARFGRAGAVAHRLATGVDERPPVAVDPAPERQVERVFEPPVEQVPPVVFVAKQLADQLAHTLAAQGRVCTRLLVVAETEHGERTERCWYRSGGLSAAAMVERVRWQLDGWVASPGGLSAGIVLIRLVPAELRGDDGTQVGLWGGRTQADLDAARAIARLVGLAGDESVRVPAWRGGRLPADRYQWVPASSADLEDPASRLTHDPGPWPGATPAPSPAVVTLEPVQIELLDDHGASLQVGGRGELSARPATMVLHGLERQVLAWAGPWPLEQVWWDPRRHRRVARLQVVTIDGAAHLVMAEQRRWWLCAVYG
jgi:protein ImuB